MIKATVNIDEVQRLLVEQDDAMAKTLMLVTGAVRDAFDRNMDDDSFTQLLQDYEALLRSADRFYEAIALVLQEHIRDMSRKRQVLSQAIANMAELNGNGEGWLVAQQNLIEATKSVNHLRVVDD